MKPRQRSEGCSLSQPAITKATGQVLLTKASASYRSFVRELTIPEYVDYRSVYEVSICLTYISYMEVTWLSSRIYERISQGGR